MHPIYISIVRQPVSQIADTVDAVSGNQWVTDMASIKGAEETKVVSINTAIGLFLGNIDKRTQRAKQFAAVLDDIVSDLGGEDSVTAAKFELARRAAAMSVLLSDLDKDIIEGRAVDVSALTSLTNALGRVLGRLGLERVPRDVTTTLERYLEHQGEAAQ